MENEEKPIWYYIVCIAVIAVAIWFYEDQKSKCNGVLVRGALEYVCINAASVKK